MKFSRIIHTNDHCSEEYTLKDRTTSRYKHFSIKSTTLETIQRIYNSSAFYCQVCNNCMWMPHRKNDTCVIFNAIVQMLFMISQTDIVSRVVMYLGVSTQKLFFKHIRSKSTSKFTTFYLFIFWCRNIKMDLIKIYIINILQFIRLYTMKFK